MIELVDVSKKYKDKVIFENVSLKIDKGDCVGIVGYNGSGKSVLLRLFCGFSLADSGKVIIDNKIIGKDIDFIEDAGVFINEPGFMNHLSGLENLLMLAEIKKKISKQDVINILEKFNLKKDMNKKVKAYSQGMIQRLRMAQAIMEDPQTLIFDEPMNALDKEGTEIVHNIMNESKKARKTIIYTSHNNDDIRLFSDYILRVDNGSVTREQNVVQQQ